ncbi:MAG: hypothetical protein PHR35_18160 [Kiritimatiellae bacterium]|nr:hypothetical protein [Kiritimatiellia bacterium]
MVTYFAGGDNYFSHPEGDERSFRFALATLMANGHVRACELEGPPLCVPHRTLMNWSRQVREQGPASFFAPARRGGSRVMTQEMIVRCEHLLGAGHTVAATARQAGVLESTLRKAVDRGAVSRAVRGATPAPPDRGTSKSERSQADAAAGLGTACTRADERVAAAMGLATGAATRFEASADVMFGGLLAGLPALCANGLLSGIGKHLHLRTGFYTCVHILLTLAFMALARIRRPENLRHVPPGELGKVVGLDRVPEVKTLRAKVTEMATTGHPEAWMHELSRTWMEADPAQAGYLYVDGHVRVYHGNSAHLGRRYVSRERLCLRGTTDYWVNDALGRPFFVVSQAVTDGLAAALVNDILPHLRASVPGQPNEAQLEADPLLHRFVAVFDREGATYSLLAKLWDQRVGALTYRKNVQDQWPADAFDEVEVPVPGGGSTRMRLAVRETEVRCDERALPVTEVRRLTADGHQTAIICTARRLDPTVMAGRMFARWCQENFFAYMMEHYDIDGLVQYGVESLPGATQVINPAWRALDKAVTATRRALQKLQAQLGALPRPETGAAIQKHAELHEQIKTVQAQLEEQREQRKQTAKKVPLSSLPEDQRVTQLVPLNKILTDCVKMIAYRAETALVALLRPHLSNEEESRALIRELFVSAADIEPDDDARTLTVRIHRMACPAHDKAMAALLHQLTQLEFRHPETGHRIVYTLT